MQILSLFMLLQSASEAVGETHHAVEELGAVTVVLALLGGLVKIWYSARKAKAELDHTKAVMAREDADKRKLEQKLESDPSMTLSGTKNPGRSTAQLVEMIHDNQKRFEENTTKNLSEIREFMGRVKEKLNMP